MNAAILLMTSVMGQGAPVPEGAKAAAPAAPAVVAPAPIVSTSTGNCGGGVAGCGDSCGNDCYKPNLFDRLRARFAHPCHDSCASPCAAPVVHHAPCAPVCDPCLKPTLWERMKARFGKHGCCEAPCDGGCSGCGSPAPVVVPAAPVPAAEPIQKPKAMPSPESPKTGGLVPVTPITPTVGRSSF